MVRRLDAAIPVKGLVMQLSWGYGGDFFSSAGQQAQRRWPQSTHSAGSNKYGPGKWSADALAIAQKQNHVVLSSYSVCRRACGREGSRGWGLQKRCPYFREILPSTLSRRAIRVSNLTARDNSAPSSGRPTESGETHQLSRTAIGLKSVNRQYNKRKR